MKSYKKPVISAKELIIMPLMTSPGTEVPIEDKPGEPGESNMRRRWGDLWDE